MPSAETGASGSGALGRALDLGLATAGLVVLAPVLGVVAVAIKASDGGPVFHRAERVGRAGRPFRLYKFRSMVPDADRTGPAVTGAADARVTPLGRWLRRTKADELPQLLNVVRGDMALVGPRPEDPRYVETYSPEQRRVLQSRPGITSPATLVYRREEEILTGPDWERTYVERVLPDKLAIELRYLERRSLRTDVGVLLRTLAGIVR